MPVAFESEQAGKRQAWANKIANIQATNFPFTSMAAKAEAPGQVLETWQVKTYPDVDFLGVPDGKDATDFESNPRKEIQMRAEKTWRKPGVSDFADEAEIVGLSGNESAMQIADALILLKKKMEQRCCSNYDAQADNGVVGNETRGMFKYLENTAQGYLPVPDGFRTPTASRYTSTVALLTEATFLPLCRSSYIQRKGPFKTDAFLGINLKAAFTEFTKYVDTVGGKTAVRQFQGALGDKNYVSVVDKLLLDTGEIDLHPTPYLYKLRETGADQAQTHNSGFIVDMDMCRIAYTRLPRVVKLPYLGGSNKAIVDALYMNLMDNPLGGIALVCAS
jgi:hypothetical protein